MLALIQKFQ